MNGQKASYSYSGWQRLRSLCVAMRQTEEKVQKLKEEIEEKLKITKKIRDKRADIQFSRVTIGSLESQLEVRKAKVRTLSARLSRQRRNFGERDAKLVHFRNNVQECDENLMQIQRNYVSKREKLIWTAAQLFTRRKQLARDLMFAYPVEQQTHPPVSSKVSSCPCQNFFKIVNVHLPDAESYPGHSDVDMSVGLGFVCHALCTLSQLFNIPLRYRTLFAGSRCSVVDNIDPHLPSNQTMFPLFCRGQDKAAFQYGVFLLNKNIAQFRCDCGLNTDDLRCTLQNLLSIMDYLSGAKIETLVPNPFLSTRSLSIRTNSADSNSAMSSVAEERRQPYERDRVRSFGRHANGSAPGVVNVLSVEAVALNGVENNNAASPLFADAADSTTFSSKDCFERSRNILRTCYFGADDFDDDDAELQKSLHGRYENGELF